MKTIPLTRTTGVVFGWAGSDEPAWYHTNQDGERSRQVFAIEYHRGGLDRWLVRWTCLRLLVALIWVAPTPAAGKEEK